MAKKPKVSKNPVEAISKAAEDGIKIPTKFFNPLFKYLNEEYLKKEKREIKNG